MQITPQGVNLLDTDNLHLHKFSAQAKSTNQYGNRSVPVDVHGGIRRPVSLLTIPTESLTHITAFLDPVSLFALGRTNKVLHDHVKDDNTWHSAFACQFLGERPERSDSQQSILLRRCEDSWKRELVLRCNSIRRWERCRTGTVSHIPHYSPIAGMHLLSDRSYGPALLSVSLQYGIIARSFPLNGKVLKGFISASDGFGIGNGNPNAEFTPNVSSCAVTTEGWTARVAFGFTNGEVALASAVRVMESGRTTNRVIRCLINEQHGGLVVDIAWDGLIFVTAGVDGEVRVWDAKRMRCVYVLQDQRGVIPDPCVHVLSDLERGVVLAAKQSGTVVVWTGLSVTDERSEVIITPSTMHLPPLGVHTDESKEPTCIFMDRSVANDQLCYGIHFAGDMHFYRINIDLGSRQKEVIQFGDGPLAPIQVLYPFWTSEKEDGRTVIFAGNSLGCVSLFVWASKPEPSKNEVSSFRRLDVTSDGAGISAIACSSYVLAIGTTLGTTTVYDSLTLRLLREFPSPIPRPNSGATPVKDIIIEKDLLLVAVGERVLAWEAKPVRSHKPLKVVKKASAKGRNAKWYKRLELAQDISESRKAVEDAQSCERRSHERRRAHQAALAGLGLDEHEALQYVLMLSRDEAAEQNQDQALHHESAFEADFEDMGNVSSASMSRSSSCSGQADEDQTTSNGSPLFRPTDPNVEASPLVHSELAEAEGDGVGLDDGETVLPSVDNPKQFPAISSSVSSSSSLPHPSPPTPSTPWSARVKASSSSPRPSSSTSAAIVSVTADSMTRSVSGPPTSTDTSGPSLLSETLRLYNRGQAGNAGGSVSSTGTPSQNVNDEEEMDADLKLAIELSLAEQLSLKEV